MSSPSPIPPPHSNLEDPFDDTHIAREPAPPVPPRRSSQPDFPDITDRLDRINRAITSPPTNFDAMVPCRQLSTFQDLDEAQRKKEEKQPLRRLKNLLKATLHFRKSK